VTAGAGLLGLMKDSIIVIITQSKRQAAR